MAIRGPFRIILRVDSSREYGTTIASLLGNSISRLTRLAVNQRGLQPQPKTERKDEFDPTDGKAIPRIRVPKQADLQYPRFIRGIALPSVGIIRLFVQSEMRAGPQENRRIVIRLELK